MVEPIQRLQIARVYGDIHLIGFAIAICLIVTGL